MGPSNVHTVSSLALAATKTPTRGARVLKGRTRPMCRYQSADATMTLREGYEEYLAAIAATVGDGFYDESKLSAMSGELFRNHDTVHVVFGLDTHLEHEVLADMTTFFAVDISARRYISYLTSVPEAADAIKQVGGVWNMVKITVMTLPKVWRAFRCSRRMVKKWPWKDHAAFNDTPLCDIRRAFGITLVQ